MSKRKKGNKSGGEPQSAEKDNAILFVLVLLLFLGSGLSALVYQVVWTRLLVLVFGATTFATSCVLGAFMGGLALGSWLAGRYADRIRRPFLWYGILEAVIGVWAVLIPLMVQAALPLYKTIYAQTHLSVLSFGALQFVVVGLILLVPTTCMGATLPLLARFVTTSIDRAGERIGTLYAVNTLGAIAGAALAGFFLLPVYGLMISVILAALVNFVLCGVVLLTAPPKGELFALDPKPQEEEKQALPLPLVVTLVAFALSGAVAMIYEVVWTRYLVFAVGGSTYAFSIMVTTFLSGIFLGSIVCARFIDGAKRPILVFAILEVILGFITVATMLAFNYVPFWILKAVANNPANEGAMLAARIWFSAVVLVPLTLCLGAIFPAVIKICARDLGRVGRSVGTAYAANTIGAIAGAVTSGFVLLPYLGSELTLVLCAAVNLLLGLLLLLADEEAGMKLKAGACVVILASCGYLCLRPKIFDGVTLLHSQTEMRSFKQGMRLPYSAYDDWRAQVHKVYDLPFWKDGATCNVGVLEQKLKKGSSFSIVTSGEIDGSDSGDMALQILLSGYPLLARPDAKDVAMVGWGTGVSAGVATLFPIQSLTAIEIEPAVVEATKFFHHVNYAPENNPKVKIEYNDGRNFLLATDRKYDVLISEPSNPWRAGVCNLFTTEYFGICKSRLKEGGLFTLWIQISEVPPDMLKSVLSALRNHFSQAVIFMPNVSNLIIVASDSPVLLKPREIDRLLEDPKIGADLAKAHVRTSERLISQIQVASDGYAELTQGVVANSDDKNDLEYVVAKHYQSKLFFKDNIELLLKYSGSPWNNVDWKGFSNDEKSAFMKRVAECTRTALDVRNLPMGAKWSAEASKVATFISPAPAGK